MTKLNPFTPYEALAKTELLIEEARERIERAQKRLFESHSAITLQNRDSHSVTQHLQSLREENHA